MLTQTESEPVLRKISIPKFIKNDSVIIITNIVCSAKFGECLDLNYLGKVLRNVEPKKRSLQIQKRYPKSWILLFRTGSILSFGTNTETNALKSIKSITMTIKKHTNNKYDHIKKITKFKISNIVATMDLNIVFSLNKLVEDLKVLPYTCKYDPEEFSSIRCTGFHPVNKKLFIGINKNGKLIFTGAKTKYEIKEAFSILLPFLRKNCNL